MSIDEAGAEFVALLVGGFLELVVDVDCGLELPNAEARTWAICCASQARVMLSGKFFASSMMKTSLAERRPSISAEAMSSFLRICPRLSASPMALDRCQCLLGLVLELRVAWPAHRYSSIGS